MKLEKSYDGKEKRVEFELVLLSEWRTVVIRHDLGVSSLTV